MQDISFLPKNMIVFLWKTNDLPLAQEEYLLLAQEHDLLFVHEESLLLRQGDDP